MIAGRYVELGNDGTTLVIARDSTGILHVSIRRLTDDLTLTVMVSAQSVTEGLAALEPETPNA